MLGGLAYALRAALWALTSDPLLFVAIAPLGGFGYALFYVGTVTYVSRAVAPSVHATAQGLFSGTAMSIGSILGSVIGGALAAELTIPGMFIVSAVATALGAGIVLWATGARKTARSTPVVPLASTMAAVAHSATEPPPATSTQDETRRIPR